MARWKDAHCPKCGTPNAQRWLWKVRCPRYGCPHYDPEITGQRTDTPPPAPLSTSSHDAPPPPQRTLTGTFNPAENAIQISYTNYLGLEKTFTGDRATLRKRGRHISLRLVPTGQRCTFLISRLKNASELESLCLKEKQLTPVERQILGYHSKHGTTSPRHQAALQKLAC